MKRTMNLCIATVAMTCLLVSSVQAQEATNRDRTQTSRTDAGKLDAKTQGANVRVSQLIGANIQNEQGKGVGAISDIVIDANSAKVRYAAVTYGGFLGLGDKLFAVPFEAFKIKVDPDRTNNGNVDADDYVLVLNVTQQQLEGQQGFDQDHWPNMADAQWAADLDKRYGVERTATPAERLERLNRTRNQKN